MVRCMRAVEGTEEIRPSTDITHLEKAHRLRRMLREVICLLIELPVDVAEHRRLRRGGTETMVKKQRETGMASSQRTTDRKIPWISDTLQPPHHGVVITCNL